MEQPAPNLTSKPLPGLVPCLDAGQFFPSKHRSASQALKPYPKMLDNGVPTETDPTHPQGPAPGPQSDNPSRISWHIFQSVDPWWSQAVLAEASPDLSPVFPLQCPEVSSTSLYAPHFPSPSFLSIKGSKKTLTILVQMQQFTGCSGQSGSRIRKERFL